jgi:shikimate kinase
MRIYLVGYMGAGKSTTSKRLAHKLGWEAYDTDRLFEARYKISINDFFHKYDADLFRRLETQILHNTLLYDNAVIATGGGTACFNDNMEWMNQNGFTIFLKISPESAITRLSQSKVRRPIIYDRPPEELEAFIKNNYAERIPFYEQAQLTVKSENLDLDALVTLIPKE